MKIGFRPMQGGERFEHTLEEVMFGEDAGFDSAFLTEHHGWDISWPSPHMALAALATRTETITLGTSIMLLPLYNPVRLAGELAMLDQISGGRAAIGVGLGYQEREFDALNVPVEGRVTRFADSIRLIQRLFEEETVEFAGKTHELSDFSLSPRPAQDGGPPLLVGGRAEPALKRAAVFGDEWLPSWTDDLERLRADRQRYTAFLEEAGGDPASKDFPVIRAVSVAEDHQQAADWARKYYQPTIETYLENGYEMGVDPDSFTDIMDIAEDRFLIGTPAEVTEQLNRFVGGFGTNHLILKVFGPGMTHGDVLDALDLLGDEVLPHVDD